MGEILAIVIFWIVFGAISRSGKKKAQQSKRTPIPYQPEPSTAAQKPFAGIGNLFDALQNMDGMEELKELGSLFSTTPKPQTTTMPTAVPKPEVTQSHEEEARFSVKVPSMQSRLKHNMVVPTGGSLDVPEEMPSSEGADPCHDTLFSADMDVGDDEETFSEGFEPSPSDWMRGIVLSEILQPPKALQRGNYR